MISKLSRISAGFFAKKNVIPQDRINVYSYGFELLYSTILNGLSILLIAAIFDSALNAVLFSLGFIPLRVMGGGYHAKHHWSCFLSLNVIFLLINILVKINEDSIALPFMAVSVVVTLILVWILAPVEAKNKPIKEEKKAILRVRSIAIALFNMILCIANYFLFEARSTLLLYYFTGALAASLLLVVAAIFHD